MEITNDASASNGTIDEMGCNPIIDRVMSDSGHEDDITVEDEVVGANLAVGNGPKKKKKSKPKSQRAAVKSHFIPHVLYSCILIRIIGLESRNWV